MEPIIVTPLDGETIDELFARLERDHGPFYVGDTITIVPMEGASNTIKEARIVKQSVAGELLSDTPG